MSRHRAAGRSSRDPWPAALGVWAGLATHLGVAVVAVPLWLLFLAYALRPTEATT